MMKTVYKIQVLNKKNLTANMNQKKYLNKKKPL